MDNNYYNNLPKKRMGAGALILNEQGEVLIVKQSYKDYWAIAGGVVDDGESPRVACIREVREELRIDLKVAEFLCLDHVNLIEDGESREHLQSIFFGGILNEAEIAEIKNDGEEILEYRFVNINEALPMLGEKLRKRLPKALEAYKKESAVYLENGELIK